MKPVQLVFLLLGPVLIDAVTSGGGPCSSSILDSSFKSVSTVLIDIDHTPVISGGILVYDDTSFFTDVLGYDEAQLQDYVDNEVMEFYITRFGLDFSNSVPDENGRRHFENATLVFASSDPTFAQSHVSNADPLVSGIKTPEYLQNRVGGLVAIFNGPQLLRGTYGGEDGIIIGLYPGENMISGFYYCADCPNGPLRMTLKAITPMRVEPYDGNVIFNVEYGHPELGRGIGRGIARGDPTDDPTLVHVEFRLTISFATGVRCEPDGLNLG